MVKAHHFVCDDSQHLLLSQESTECSPPIKCNTLRRPINLQARGVNITHDVSAPQTMIQVCLPQPHIDALVSGNVLGPLCLALEFRNLWIIVCFRLDVESHQFSFGPWIVTWQEGAELVIDYDSGADIERDNEMLDPAVAEISFDAAECGV